MKISSINFIQNNRNVEQTNVFQTKPMIVDTFEKSNISFGSNEESNLFSSLLADSFANIFSSVLSSFSGITSFLDEIRIEKQLDNILEACKDKKVREALRKSRNRKLDDFMPMTLFNSPSDRTYIINLLQESGIKNVGIFEHFTQIFSRNPKPFDGQNMEAIKIYGLLKNKEDLSRYGELLLYLYNEEDSHDNPDFEKLNTTSSFLRRIGLNNLDEFNSKFGHLSTKFNRFDDISDKADAIEYAQSTYEPKIQLLDDVIKQNPNLKSKNVEQTYSSISDIIDYFYNENDGVSLDGLLEVMDYAISHGKFKSSGLKQISHLFNDFQAAEDKIAFYKFLKNCDVSISDFNNLSGKSVVSDVDTIDIFANKEELTSTIGQLKNINQQQAFEYYKKFKDVINGAYDNKTGSTEEISSLIRIIDEFKLKDSNSFLDFYRSAYGMKKQSITSSELKEFIELLEYNHSPNILNEARIQKTTAVELLTKEKDQFLSIKKDIEDFIVSDEKAYFIGETPLSIYKKYRDSLLESENDIPSVLKNIVNFDIAGQEDYKSKFTNIEKFVQFFKDRESLMKFFTQNNIKFDNSEEDNERINNCHAIFNSLFDEENKEQSLQRIQYFAESGFISNSEKRLSELLAKMQTEETRKTVLALIADKEIPSIAQMEKFFKQYQTKSSNNRDLITFLKNLPTGTDFTSGVQLLNQIQHEIDKLCIPSSINADNIISLDISKFQGQKEIPITDIVELLDKMYKSPEGRNFFSVMASSKMHQREKMDTFRVALEIAKSIDKSKESYQNLSRLLCLDKSTLGLEHDCSTYIYARAIQNELPKELIELVASNDWTQYAKGGNKVPELGLHARLRAIDRFALDEVSNIKEISTPEVKAKLTDLLKTIYTTQPTEIRGSESDKKIIADFVHNGREIEVVFGQDGKMVTVVPRRNYKVA